MSKTLRAFGAKPVRCWPDNSLDTHDVQNKNDGLPDIKRTVIRSGQTPDFTATHAAVAAVAPFPAWRGSQG
jgi:hypothetical protein